MKGLSKKDRNTAVILIVFIIVLITSLILMLNGKINLSALMGNTAQARYTCPSGYRLDGSKCYRTIVVGKVVTKKTPQCTKGTLKNGVCEINATIKSYTIYCPRHTKYDSSTGQCVKSSTPVYKYYCTHNGKLTTKKLKCTLSKKATKKCPSGYKAKNLTTCEADAKYNVVPACSGGWKLKGTKCVKNGKTPNYTCPKYWKLKGSKCITNPTTLNQPVCTSGVKEKNGLRCLKTEIINATRRR